ncbi:MAG: asparaginase [Alphaproteobacteria bacterium]|nr:asparaginase [Alphaproteobacteria bacterium]
MNPILVDVLRADHIESVHRGAVYVVDDGGQELLSIGDVDKLVFPRSAIKIMQALPLAESGAIEALRLNDKQLSLICSSHNGEVRHTRMAQSILAGSGLDVSDLQCGSHAPLYREAADELVRTGENACALHNNCSGKHSGMLAFAKHAGFETKDYIELEHPVQREVLKVMAELTEFDLTTAPCGFDGCSLPTWAAPLTAWAKAFAKISRGTGLGDVRGAAVAKLRGAVMAEPFYVAGSERYCTDIMSQLSTPIFVKTGAEGVFCVSLPEHGIGIALKCEDGMSRGAEMMLSATLNKLGVLKPGDDAVMKKFTSQILKNCNGYEVAEIRPSEFWGF